MSAVHRSGDTLRGYVRDTELFKDEEQDCCNRQAVRVETATESYGGGGGGGGLGDLGGGGFGFPIQFPPTYLTLMTS